MHHELLEKGERWLQLVVVIVQVSTTAETTMVWFATGDILDNIVYQDQA